MRIRSIKPSFFKDEDLAELPPIVRLLFIGLWGLADKEGRLEDRPRLIKAEVLPYSRAKIDGFLDLLHTSRFINRYTTHDKKYIQVEGFVKHQRITGKESESESNIPPPTHRLIGETTGKQRGNNWETPEKTGREGSKEGEVNTLSPLSPLGKIEVPEDLKVWELELTNWLAYKQEKKQAYRGSHGLSALWSRIRKIDPSARKEAIEQSMANNYAGIFPPKGDYDVSKTKGGATAVAGKYSAI